MFPVFDVPPDAQPLTSEMGWPPGKTDFTAANPQKSSTASCCHR